MRLGKGAHLRIGDQDSGRGRGPGSGMLIFQDREEEKEVVTSTERAAILLTRSQIGIRKMFP